MPRTKKENEAVAIEQTDVEPETEAEAPAPIRASGTLLDGTTIEFDTYIDGSMKVASPANLAGMALVRRNDGTKTTPGSLKLVGKPAK